MDSQLMRVGTLAKRTGLSVRTLHYYDEVGLLKPARRTASGHRLYGAEQVRRLLQIRSLRGLGLSLEQIGECLSRPEYALERILTEQMVALEERIAGQRRLRERLERVVERLRAQESPSIQELIQTIEVMTMYEDYYTPEQLEQLKQRKTEVGEERIRQVEAEWQKLIERIRAQMDRGADPGSEAVQDLARRWRDLQQQTVREFTGGDPELKNSLAAMYRDRPAELGHFGLDSDLLDYVAAATRQLAD